MTTPLLDAAASNTATPRHTYGRRLRLDTPDRVRRELVRLYRRGRDGELAAKDASLLAGVLAMVGALVGSHACQDDQLREGT